MLSCQNWNQVTGFLADAILEHAGLGQVVLDTHAACPLRREISSTAATRSGDQVGVVQAAGGNVPGTCHPGATHQGLGQVAVLSSGDPPCAAASESP